MVKCKCMVCEVTYFKEGSMSGVSHGICSQDCALVYRLWFRKGQKLTLAHFKLIFEMGCINRTTMVQ